MMGKREYLSKGHRLQYLSQQRVFEVAGAFADVLNKYLNGDGKLNYAATSWRSARNTLIAFCGWLQSTGILDLNQITPDTITDYMLHQRERGLTLDGYLGQISAFFTWARGRGYRKGASPIIPRFHRARQSKSVPRDYSVAEVAAILPALDKRGTTMMKLVVAIGLESGCRISETGGLRLGDINWERQTLFISKSKNGTQRHTFFDVNTRTYLELWLKERDPHCGHDYLFYTANLAPITFSGCLQTLIKRTICKSKEFPEGVPSFSSHRLRHTWASALSNGGMDPTCLMPLGGWKCWASMQRYVNTSETRVEEQYHEANLKSQEDQQWSDETLTSMDDLVAENGAEQE
jgi:integrase